MALQRTEPLRLHDVIKTYRYLRIGMIGAVVLLAASIGIERSKVDCWQTSISAYYYTPARAVLDRMSAGLGWRTVTEVMATTRPQPRSAMAGTAAWHMATVDSRFSSSADW